MAERRRLPVIQSSKEPGEKGADDQVDENAIEERPPWHWVGFGAVAIFATWLPAAFLAQKIGEHLVRRRFGDATEEEVAQRLMDLPKDQLVMLFLPLGIMHLAALAIGSAAGGYVVGRFGSGTTLREPALSGGVVALMAIMLTIGRGGLVSALVTGAVVLLIAVGCAALGGRKGLKSKDKSAPIARA